MARVACEDKFGPKRYNHFKIEKTYNSLRLLFLIENKLFLLAKGIKKPARKRDKTRAQTYAAETDEEAGYPKEE